MRSYEFVASAAFEMCEARFQINWTLDLNQIIVIIMKKLALWQKSVNQELSKLMMLFKPLSI